MPRYYSEKLSTERLRRCYEIAPPRVRQYLEAEIGHVLGHVRPGDVFLELGCGYGRVMERIADRAGKVIGIDTSPANVQMARRLLADHGNCDVLRMDAISLGFRDQVFDVVVCAQNGISAFGVDPEALIAESVRVTRAGGRVLFSSYADGFWEPRLEWFRLQAEQGLIGEIDWDATGDGVIVGKDGFRATTIDAAGFEELTSNLAVQRRVVEVDGSSLFCELGV